MEIMSLVEQLNHRILVISCFFMPFIHISNSDAAIGLNNDDESSVSSDAHKRRSSFR